MFQTFFFVVGPALLMGGIGSAIFVHAARMYRVAQCGKRELQIKQHSEWVREAQSALGTAQYKLYNDTSLEAEFGREYLRQVEKLLDTAPTQKELG